MGHNSRQRCVEFVNNNEEDWGDVKIVVFDTPFETDKPYSERFAILKQRTLP
jgi:hypothetical protein